MNKKTGRKLRLQAASIRRLTHPDDLAAARGGKIIIVGTVGCLTKDKYTGCPACPGQPTRIFCD